MDIDNIQRIAYGNAVRRGFWGNGYTVGDAISHLRKEIDELSFADSEEDRTLETGDIMLLCMSILYHRGVKVSDAIKKTVQKELLR